MMLLYDDSTLLYLTHLRFIETRVTKYNMCFWDIISRSNHIVLIIFIVTILTTIMNYSKITQDAVLN